MNIATLTESRTWLLAGWTMLHFLWVGTLIALVNAALRRMLRRAPPEARYGLALLGFATMAATPVLIAWCLFEVEGPAPVPIPHSKSNRQVHQLIAKDFKLPEADWPAIPASSPSTRASVPRISRVDPKELLATVAAGLPYLWLAGTPATFLVLATGLVGAERLRRQSRPLVDAELHERCRRLARTLGLDRPIALGVCDRLVTPALLGVVRPMILLPAAALTGWSPDQLEMALLHELAHVRRHDNLVNLAQRMIEAVLFFHPAVWWLSAWVRREREHCCDKAVLAHTGRPRPYAELLAALASHDASPGRTAMAMAEAPVVDRIRRIMDIEEQPMRLSRFFVAFVAILLVTPAAMISLQADPPEPQSGKAQPDATTESRLDQIIQRTLQDVERLESPRERARALTPIAGAQARRDSQREAARRTFAKAVAIAETLPINDHPASLRTEHLISEILHAGDREDLLRRLPRMVQSLKLPSRLGSLDDSMFDPHILVWIARAQEKAGFRDDAIDSMRKLQKIAQQPANNDLVKSDLFEPMVKTQVALEDHEGARETIRLAIEFYKTTEETELRQISPYLLTLLKATSGDLAGAYRTIQDFAVFRGPAAAKLRHTTLFSLVKQIKTGDENVAGPILKEAVQFVESHDPYSYPASRDRDLKAIAEAMARLRRFDDATKAARRIEINYDREPGLRDGNLPSSRRGSDAYQQAEAFACIAEEQAKVGDRAGVQQSAKEIARIVAMVPVRRELDLPLSAMSRSLVKVGDLAGALRLVDAMPADDQLNPRISIAMVQRNLGDEDGAQATLAVARRRLQTQLDALEPVQPDSPAPVTDKRDSVLRQTCRVLAAQGDLKGAIATTQQIHSPLIRSQVMVNMARNQASRNDLEGAMKIVNQLDSPQLRLEAIETMLAALPERK